MGGPVHIENLRSENPVDMGILSGMDPDTGGHYMDRSLAGHIICQTDK